MLAELREDNASLTLNMREVHSLCDEAGDVATASLLENWIDESEKRTWFLFECGRHAEGQAARRARETNCGRPFSQISRLRFIDGCKGPLGESRPFGSNSSPNKRRHQ